MEVRIQLIWSESTISYIISTRYWLTQEWILTNQGSPKNIFLIKKMIYLSITYSIWFNFKPKLYCFLFVFVILFFFFNKNWAIKAGYLLFLSQESSPTLTLFSSKVSISKIEHWHHPLSLLDQKQIISCVFFLFVFFFFVFLCTFFVCVLTSGVGCVAWS